MSNGGIVNAVTRSNDRLLPTGAPPRRPPASPPRLLATPCDSVTRLGHQAPGRAHALPDALTAVGPVLDRGTPAAQPEWREVERAPPVEHELRLHLANHRRELESVA